MTKKTLFVHLLALGLSFASLMTGCTNETPDESVGQSSQEEFSTEAVQETSTKATEEPTTDGGTTEATTENNTATSTEPSTEEPTEGSTGQEMITYQAGDKLSFTFSNPVEISLGDKTIQVPDWFLGKLLNPGEVGYALPDRNKRYAPLEDIQFLVDADINDDTGAVKKAAEQLLVEETNVRIEMKTATTSIQGKNLLIPLCTGDTWNHVYVPESGDVVVIDGVTWDWTPEWLFEMSDWTGYMWWTNYYDTDVRVVDIDQSDSFVEFLVCTESKSTILRYDGTTLYQIAVIPSGYSFAGFPGDGTIQLCVDYFSIPVEMTSLIFIATLEDGVLYRHSIPDRLYELPARREEERSDEEWNADLRNLVAITLYATPEYTSETFTLEPQRIDWCQMLLGEEEGVDWVKIKGLADGVEGWICVEDMNDEDYAGELLSP